VHLTLPMGASSSEPIRTTPEGSLTIDQRLNVGGVYILAWIVAAYFGIFGFRIGMVLHLALPLLAVVAALVFPRDFTLLKNFSRSPYGLAGMWLIAGTLFFGSPSYVGFLDAHDPLGRPGYLIGGILAGAAIVAAPIPKRKISHLLHCLQLLLMSLLYGHVAVREVNTLFDQSLRTVYESRVLGDGGHGYSSPHLYFIEPWGPVKADARATIPQFGHHFRIGDPICMVLRKGALGAPWYTATQCPGK
jgi:hypothetical protein